MRKYCFTYRSITSAMQAQNVLKQAGIRSTLRRTPTSVRTNGCGYCLMIDRESFSAAESMLAKTGYRKIYWADGRDAWQEVGK